MKTPNIAELRRLQHTFNVFKDERTMAGNLAKAKSALCAALAASNANTRGGE